jgi:histidinol-phosphate phosphatase family protein
MRAVFLDRDGVLIEERNYLSRVEEVVIFPGTGVALRRLQDAAFGLFVVTNQSGVARGYFTLADVERVHRHLLDEFARDGVQVQHIYVAPEAPEQPSRGRKPSPQFLFDARNQFGVDLAQSYMIGDKLIDLECGWNAGVKKSLLVRTGYGRELERSQDLPPGRAVVVNDLAEAADWILQDSAQLPTLRERHNPVKTVAVIGASNDRNKYGNKAVRAFRQQHYQVYPVNVKEKEIEGLPAFKSILEVPVRPAMVSVYVPPERLLGILPDIAARGCNELWLNPGSESDQVLAEAERLGLNVIQACSILGVGLSPEAL